MMFVSGSAHRQLRAQHEGLYLAYQALLSKWNRLAERINKLGGEDFLSGEREKPFCDEDIRKLLQLCHPDVHGGKPLAQEMTVRLLEMRK